MKITKYNAICNLGNNIEEIFTNAVNGVNDCFEMSSDYISGKMVRAGAVHSQLPQISSPDFDIRCNRLVLACLDSFEIEKYDKTRLAVVCATTNTGVEEFEKSQNPKHAEISNPAEFVYKYFGLKNYYTSVSTACSSGIKAFMIAKNLLDSNYADYVLVFGTDRLAKVPFYGFASLEVLSAEATIPFSKNRKGINIGEGTACFMLEREGEGITVAGLGETTDSYHITTPDPEGANAEKAIREALKGFSPDEVDYINLHGTGTRANDLMEGRAVYRIFRDKVPASSTKPLTGHCLGASASIETALCCRLLDEGHGKVFPHIYDGCYDDEIPKINLADKNTCIKSIKSCLCTSFGFGGTNCAIYLKR